MRLVAEDVDAATLDAVRALVGIRRLDMDKLAERAGLARASVSRILRGSLRANPETVRTLLKAAADDYDPAPPKRQPKRGPRPKRREEVAA